MYARVQHAQAHPETHASTSAHASASAPQYQYSPHLPPNGGTYSLDAQAWAPGSQQSANHIPLFTQVEHQYTPRPQFAPVATQYQSFESLQPQHDGVKQQGFPQASRDAAGVTGPNLSSASSPWIEGRNYSQFQTTGTTTGPADPTVWLRLPNAPSHALPSSNDIPPPRQEKQEEALLIEL
jgi:hypothetical protein